MGTGHGDCRGGARIDSRRIAPRSRTRPYLLCTISCLADRRAVLLERARRSRSHHAHAAGLRRMHFHGPSVAQVCTTFLRKLHATGTRERTPAKRICKFRTMPVPAPCPLCPKRMEAQELCVKKPVAGEGGSRNGRLRMRSGHGIIVQKMRSVPHSFVTFPPVRPGYISPQRRSALFAPSAPRPKKVTKQALRSANGTPLDSGVLGRLSNQKETMC
jgi:hypothetical protein